MKTEAEILRSAVNWDYGLAMLVDGEVIQVTLYPEPPGPADWQELRDMRIEEDGAEVSTEIRLATDAEVIAWRAIVMPIEGRA